MRGPDVELDRAILALGLLLFDRDSPPFADFLASFSILFLVVAFRALPDQADGFVLPVHDTLMTVGTLVKGVLCSVG